MQGVRFPVTELSAAHIEIEMGTGWRGQRRGSDWLDREGEDLASREASRGGENPQPDHPDPPGDPSRFVQRFDGDVAFERLRYPEDDSGLGLVDVSFAFHDPILRYGGKCRRRLAFSDGRAPHERVVASGRAERFTHGSNGRFGPLGTLGRSANMRPYGDR